MCFKVFPNMYKSTQNCMITSKATLEFSGAESTFDQVELTEVFFLVLPKIYMNLPKIVIFLFFFQATFLVQRLKLC